MRRSAAFFAAIVLSGCAMPPPAELTPSQLEAIRTIRLVPPQNPPRIAFSRKTQEMTLFVKTVPEEQAQREFDKVFGARRPDVAGAINESIARALRGQGYRIAESPDAPADAVLSLELSRAGYGPGFATSVFVPQIDLRVILRRATDGAILQNQLFVYGGGAWGNIAKVQPDPDLEFRTAEDALAQPDLMARRIVIAARQLGVRVVEGLAKR